MSAKMEMWYEWSKRLWDEQQAKLKDQGEIRYTETEMAVLRKSVQANIKVHQEVRTIVERSLHYVDEPAYASARSGSRQTATWTTGGVLLEAWMRRLPTTAGSSW
ncbi:MAG: hypothetical protein ABSG43_27985 [Solirubrobacteraceae bacterium]